MASTGTVDAPPGPASQTKAGFFVRLAGALVDAIILSVVGILLRAAFNGAVGALFSLFVGFLYFTLLVGLRGQTVGMGAARVRVIDKDGGGDIGTGRGAIRWIGGYVSALFLFLGYFWMLWDAEKQCWHDKMANDIVVRV
jgi:uncharacterized RDD family membrane protein YckC